MPTDSQKSCPGAKKAKKGGCAIPVQKLRCMSVPMAARAGDMLWQCLRQGFQIWVAPHGTCPFPVPSNAGHPTQLQQCSTAPALGTASAPVPSSTLLMRAAPNWHSLWESGRSQGRVQRLQERGVNHPGGTGSQGQDWPFSRCSRERARPCGDSLDALRGIPQAENPASSSKLLPILADNSSLLGQAGPFPSKCPFPLCEGCCWLARGSWHLQFQQQKGSSP